MKNKVFKILKIIFAIDNNYVRIYMIIYMSVILRIHNLYY